MRRRERGATMPFQKSANQRFLVSTRDGGMVVLREKFAPTNNARSSNVEINSIAYRMIFIRSLAPSSNIGVLKTKNGLRPIVL